MKKPISQLTLEKYILGELSEKEKTKLETLYSAEELKIAIASFESSNEKILREYPADLMVSEILKKTNPKKTQREIPSLIRQPWLITGLSAALLLVFFAPVFLYQQYTPQERIKGLDPHLKIYRKDKTNISLLKDGEWVKAGDQIQLSYNKAQAQFGILFSLDSFGHTTLHLPEESSTEATPLTQSGEIFLSHSFQLDQAPHFERFIFVTSTQIFSVATAIAQVKNFIATQSLSDKPVVLGPLTVSITTLRKME